MTWTLFTDRDLGKRFPDILAKAGLDVVPHASRFPPDVPDEVWLEEAGRRGWLAITHDQRIRYKPNELEAVVRHGVWLVVVIGKASFSELAESFVLTWPRIQGFVQMTEPPFIAKVYRSPKQGSPDATTAGRVELWYPR